MLILAMLTAAVPVRAQPLGIDFSDACPAKLEATAQGDGSILLEVDASTDVMLYRDDAPVEQINGSGAHVDADVAAGVTYSYHITALVGGQESPPCDEVTVTARAAAKVEANATAQGNASADANATAGANAHGGASVAATLEACAASLHAQARSDGSILLHVNLSAAADAVQVFRTQGSEEPVQIATLTESGAHADVDAEAGVAYSYSVVIVVDGQTSDVCDTIELTSVPVFGGAGAVLATAIAGLAYVVRRRGA